MNSKKMSWEEIARQFDQEWVELVEYDWPAGQANPLAGIVRSHAKVRKEFYSLANLEPRPEDSAILFVGKPEIPKNTILCASMMKIRHANV